MLYWVWEIDLALLNEVVHLVLVAVEERGDAHDHLVNQDTKRPPVDGVVVAVTNQHLWRKVFSSAAETVGKLAVLYELGKPEVSNQQVSYKSLAEVL